MSEPASSRPIVPTLPSQDPDPSGRAAARALRRDTYRFVHDWPEGVATSSWLPKEADYSHAYMTGSLPAYRDIAANYVGFSAKAGSHPPDLTTLQQLLDMRPRDATAFKSNIFESARAPLQQLTADKRPDDWRDYADIFQAFPTPALTALVDDDATYGDAIAWQRVAGCNPTVLARCDDLPDRFPVREAHYKAAMGTEDSLAAARAEGRLYLADYAALDGVRCGVTEGIQKYLAAPLALYAVDRASGRLRAVCVQVGQDPSAYPIVGPQDGWHWRMANQCVQVADANHHEGSAHLGRTHMVMEAVTLAMKRELAPHHPLAVLLEPHTETTLAINASAKTSLIAPGGTVDCTFAAQIRSFGDVVCAAVQSYPLATANPRDDLAARGLLDADALPSHPYREDALPVWDAIVAFTRRYVDLVYPDAATVVADTELQGFVRALAARDGGRLPGVPEVISPAALAHLLATVVFIASAQHSAVNFSQFPTMGYVPNMGGALYTPPPTASSPNTERAYQAMLAPMRIALDSVTMVYLLSNVRDSRLGHYAAGTFADPRVAPVVQAFRADLRRIERENVARDATRWLSYPYLRPSQILQSISI